MNLAFSEEQELLRKSARDFLADRCSKALVKQMEESEKGYYVELWRDIAELGWMGLALPEKYGGAGMNFLDLGILLEEMGRACLPSPFFSTVVLGGLTILDMGNEEQKEQYLTGIASGKTILSLALTELSGRYDAASVLVNAVPDSGGYVINGTKLFVPDANVADYLLCVARTNQGVEAKDGLTVFIVDARSPGISYGALKSIANDRLGEVVFQQVRVPTKNILGQLDAGWHYVEKTIERAAVAKCCEMVGGMQRVLEMTIDYAKERKQFDRPIGSFQVIQHYCANMATDVDSSRFATYQAAWMISEGLPCTKEAAVAKAWTSEAYRRVTFLSHQIHGAIAFSQDHDLQFYTRRAEANLATFGDASFHQETVAQQMGF